MSTNGFAGFIVGLTFGAAAALLMAPKNGRDARRWIKRKGIKSGRRAVLAGLERCEDFVERGRALGDRASDVMKDRLRANFS